MILKILTNGRFHLKSVWKTRRISRDMGRPGADHREPTSASVWGSLNGHLADPEARPSLRSGSRPTGFTSTGAHRHPSAKPGLDQALAAVRGGDTLTVARQIIQAFEVRGWTIS